MSEVAYKLVPASDEVVEELFRASRQSIVDSHVEGFREIDSVGPDEHHPDFEARMLWKKVGEVNMRHVLIIPVDEQVQPWGMDLLESDDHHEILEHPYYYGMRRGAVPDGGYLDNSKAA